MTFEEKLKRRKRNKFTYLGFLLLRRMAGLFDSHCHAGATKSSLKHVHKVACGMAVMGTSEDDWEIVEEACTLYNGSRARARPSSSSSSSARAVACYGVHPWFAHKVEQGWEDRLRARLKANPLALLGECGLDKAARTPETGKNEYKLQIEVFKTQIAMAAELGRPVSVHCVRAVGKIYEILEAAAKAGALPPAVAMHSFGADAAWIARFLKLPTKVYIGFSECINHRVDRGTGDAHAKLAANVNAVPLDNLLLESDLDDPLYIDEYVKRFNRTLAALRGLPPSALGAATTANALTFIGTVGPAATGEAAAARRGGGDTEERDGGGEGKNGDDGGGGALAAAAAAAAGAAAGAAGVEDPAAALSKITIKKMKTKDIKKELTARGLSIHGQRADLIKRLVEVADDSDAGEPAAGGKGGDDSGTNASAPPPAATALPEDEEPDGESKTDNDGSTAAVEGERQWKKLVCFGTTSSGEDKP